MEQMSARTAAAIRQGSSSSATGSDRGRAENATTSRTASRPAASPRAWIFGANRWAIREFLDCGPGGRRRGRILGRVYPGRYNHSVRRRSMATAAGGLLLAVAGLALASHDPFIRSFDAVPIKATPSSASGIVLDS